MLGECRQQHDEPEIPGEYRHNNQRQERSTNVAVFSQPSDIDGFFRTCLDTAPAPDTVTAIRFSLLDSLGRHSKHAALLNTVHALVAFCFVYFDPEETNFVKQRQRR